MPNSEQHYPQIIDFQRPSTTLPVEARLKEHRWLTPKKRLGRTTSRSLRPAGDSDLDDDEHRSPGGGDQREIMPTVKTVWAFIDQTRYHVRGTPDGRLDITVRPRWPNYGKPALRSITPIPTPADNPSGGDSEPFRSPSCDAMRTQTRRTVISISRPSTIAPVAAHRSKHTAGLQPKTNGAVAITSTLAISDLPMIRTSNRRCGDSAGNYANGKTFCGPSSITNGISGSCERHDGELTLNRFGHAGQ